jgi:HopA1 effector protein family
MTTPLPQWVERDLARASQVASRHPEAGVEELQGILYRDWYAPAIPVGPTGGGQPPLFGQYRAAHAASTTFVAAQVVALAPGGIVLAAREGERPRALLAGDYCQASTERRGLAPRAGEQLLIVQRQDAPPAEGWWRTWGGGWRPSDPPALLTRLYFAVEPAQVLELIGRLTAVLQELRTPWLLKAAAEQAALGRPDAVVIYLSSADLGDVPESAPLIRALAACATGLVRDVRPA